MNEEEEIIWMDGDVFESYDDLLNHLWGRCELEGPDAQGIYTFHGGKFTKEDLVGYLKQIVAHVRDDYAIYERLYAAERERDSLRAHLAEAEAGAARLRRAVTGLIEAIRDLEGDVPDSALVMGVYGEHIGECLKALSEDAGRETLERLRKGG